MLRERDFLTQQDFCTEGDYNYLLMGRMLFFAHQAEVNYFILQGQRSDEPIPTTFDTLFAVYPAGFRPRVLLAVNDKRELTHYRKILSLHIPEETSQETREPDDPELRERYTLDSRANRMPIILMGSGTTDATNEERTLLFSIPGISPEEALGEVKRVLTRRKVDQN